MPSKLLDSQVYSGRTANHPFHWRSEENATIVQVEHNVSNIMVGKDVVNATEHLCEYVFRPPLRPPTEREWHDCSRAAAGVQE